MEGAGALLCVVFSCQVESVRNYYLTRLGVDVGPMDIILEVLAGSFVVIPGASV